MATDFDWDFSQEFEPAREFLVSYCYVTGDHYEKLKKFGYISGDKIRPLFNQFTRGILGRKSDYFLGLCKLDAQLRGLDSPQWVDIILSPKGMEGMPPLLRTPEPHEIPTSPLVNIAEPTESEDRQKLHINYLVLTAQNCAFLDVAIHYERDTVAGYISRIVREHLDRLWDVLYQKQVNAAAKSKIWF